MGLAAKRRDRQIFPVYAGTQGEKMDLMTSCCQFAHLFEEVALSSPRAKVMEDSDSQP
jgi:hypothetical protein